MKAFRFRAARVLEWRIAAADAARGAVVRARESAREAAEQVQAADARCRGAEDALRASLGSDVDAPTLTRHRNWIDHQRAAIVTHQRIHEERLAAVSAATTVLHEATRRVKVLERLRERALRRHTAAEQHEEMQRLGEFAVQQFVRSRTQGEKEHGH